MYKVVEKRNYFGTCYEIHKQDNIRLISIVGLNKVVDEFRYLILIDSYGQTIKSAYKYLNVHLDKATYKKRELAFTALKLLYSFMELFNIYKLSDIDLDERARLITFLKGGEHKTPFATYELNTKRTNITVNNYISVYRAFFKYLKIENRIFEDTHTIFRERSNKGLLGHAKKVSHEKYDASLKVINKQEVPKYISFDEYQRIIELVNKDYSTREQVVCKLMYEYGLRIGEVLGLTEEDFINNEKNPQLIIRNRITDKPWQFAKGCMKVTSTSDYEQEEYKKEDIGYQAVAITVEMAMLIQKYIEETRNPFIMSEITTYNLLTKNVAHKVTNREDIESNSYIIISKNYTPITATAWNDIIKRIFRKLNLEIDKGKKVHNLNHRFRHGFAMFKIHYENYDIVRLGSALRHSGTSTVHIYFQPTEQDKQEMAKHTQTLLMKAGIVHQDDEFIDTNTIK